MAVSIKTRTMRKAEKLENALKDVCYITDLTREQIMSKCRKTHYVDARYLLVYILSKSNLYAEEIAELMNCTTANIHNILDSIDERAQGYGMFADKLKELGKYLATEQNVA